MGWASPSPACPRVRRRRCDPRCGAWPSTAPGWRSASSPTPARSAPAGRCAIPVWRWTICLPPGSAASTSTSTSPAPGRWLGVGRPTQSPTNQGRLIGDIPAQGLRSYRLYLPLYNGLETLQLGVPEGAILAPAAVEQNRPVVVYGSSIVQGGCASRPGMAYPAILGRQLGVPMINLGFSGNGRAEPEVADLIAELDASVFILDPLPNLSAEQVRERIPPFVTALRERHPRTPIVLVGNITYLQRVLHPPGSDLGDKNAMLRPIAERLMAADPLIFHIPGETLYGDDNEATVDGVHATDLGFTRMAAAIRPVLERALNAAQ